MEALTISTTLSNYLCLSCFLGAIGQEILHWYNLRLELKNDVKFYTSPTYWVITFVSIVFFALTAKLLALLVFPSPKQLTDPILFITAFGYPLIIKQVLKLITKSIDNRNLRSRYASDLTPENNKNFEITDYIKNY